MNSPGGEVYYAYQLANVAFVHTSSEHAGAGQLAWVQDVADAVGSAPGCDWMVSLCHRPYQAEQYIGDISGWLRDSAMAVLCGTEKHVLNIGAHHHLYARGQTRDWPAYHIISGGSSWDQYWGQSNEADYDDVQKTIANWTWQLLDFDLDNKTMDARCFAEANVRFPEARRWSLDSREIDRFHRKLGRAAPAAPSVLGDFGAPRELPLTLRSSVFESPAGEAHNSSWFQVASDATFANRRIDVIRNVENIFGDTGAPDYEPVDTAAGVDLLELEIAADGLADGRYFARVRHRDANTLWSDWSPAREFEVTGSAFVGEPAIRMDGRVFKPGADLQVHYTGGSGSPTDWIGLYKRGDTPGQVSSTRWSYVPSRGGVITFPGGLPQGHWFAAFFTADGYEEIADRVGFYTGEAPGLETERTTYDEGATVPLSFSGAPGGAKDWIGIFKEGVEPAPGAFQAYEYTGGVAAGEFGFDGLPRGHYYATYLLDDGYLEVSARLRFQVGDRIAELSMPRLTVAPGDPFRVDFTGGPGIAKDWVGLFRAGDEPGAGGLIRHLYVDGRTEGGVTFRIPDLPVGDYYVALFINDSFTEVSNRVSFRVGADVGVKLELEEWDADRGEVQIAWPTLAGRSYRVQTSGDLDGWVDSEIVGGDGGVARRTVRFGVSRGFIRVVLD